jgi:hypothetical protein
MASKASISKIKKEGMPCNKPRRANDGKHDYVVKACEDGEERIVRYGDSSMPNHPDDPERRANFRARHNCDEKKDKFSAGYWACRKPSW